MLTLHAACHQWTLCGVKTADSTTGNGDEQGREDGGAVHGRQSVGQFGQRRPFHEEDNHHSRCHENHGNGKNWVDFPDDLADGQDGGNEIIDKDERTPEIDPADVLAADIAQDDGGAIDKHGTYHDKHEYGEDEHYFLGGLPEIAPHQFRLSDAAVPQ